MICNELFSLAASCCSLVEINANLNRGFGPLVFVFTSNELYEEKLLVSCSLMHCLCRYNLSFSMWGFKGLPCICGFVCPMIRKYIVLSGANEMERINTL